MAQQKTISGAMIRVYINNTPYNSCQSVSFSVDYGEDTIFGIDSAYPQEIAPNKVMVKGSISGIRIRYSGGLQASNIRPLWHKIMSSPYISIRIQDRSTGEDIIYLPQAKVTSENHSLAAKQTYKLSFNFTAIVPMFPLDRVNSK